jgi:hypothetical protein
MMPFFAAVFWHLLAIGHWQYFGLSTEVWLILGIGQFWLGIDYLKD